MGTFLDKTGVTTVWNRILANFPRQSTQAYQENGTTATQNIASGKYVYWQGNLYTTTTAISSGDTLAVGTNLQSVSTAGVLNVMKDFEDNMSPLTNNEIDTLFT